MARPETRNRHLRRAGVMILTLTLLGLARSVIAANEPDRGQGLIYGGMYTEMHQDSVAAGLPITLIYRAAAGSVVRRESRGGERGEFSFSGLPTDSPTSYVLKVAFGGKEYLSSPQRFRSGQSELPFNFVLPPGSRNESPRTGIHPAWWIALGILAIAAAAGVRLLLTKRGP